MKHVWQRSTTGDTALIWRDDLPAVADVTKFAVELTADELHDIYLALRSHELGADLTGEL